MATLKINNIDYKVKFTVRALMIYEKVSDEPFNLNNVTNQILYMYCVLLANNPDMTLTFDELVDYLDDNFNLLKDFYNLYAQYSNIASFTANDSKEEQGNP